MPGRKNAARWADCSVTRLVACIAASVFLVAAFAMLGGCGSSVADDQGAQTGAGDAAAPGDAADAAANDAATDAAANDAAVADAAGGTSGTPASEEYGDLTFFQGITLDGSTVTQDVFADADVTIINFWATYCGPCMREMPELAEFAAQLPENAQFMTVCFDAGTVGTEKVKQILADAGFEGITIIDADGDFINLAQNLMYIPTSIAFDSDGHALCEAIVGSPRDVSQAYNDLLERALEEAKS